MSRATLTTFRELGADPVTAGSPAGFDATETPEYADVVHEISLIALGGVHAVDWQLVVARSEVILRNHSKNLRIGAYLAYGLYETNGLRGLGVGFGVLAEMSDAFWGDLFPPLRRLRGRILALEWLVERVFAALGRDDAKIDASDCDFVLTQTEGLVVSLAVRSGAAGDAVSGLIPLLRTRRAAAIRTDDSRVPTNGESVLGNASVSPSAGPEAGANRVRASGAGGTRKAREQALRALGRSMLELARDLRTADVADVRAYALHRASAWLPVSVLPPSIDGRTELPPPADEVRGAIEAAMNGRDYAGALEMCEDAASDSLFWLDAHRIAAQALRSMGHEAAARTVHAQTGALLFRMPLLEGLSFRDGTPFAEPATRRWLGLAAVRTGGRAFPPLPDSSAQTPTGRSGSIGTGT